MKKVAALVHLNTALAGGRLGTSRHKVAKPNFTAQECRAIYKSEGSGETPLWRQNHIMYFALSVTTRASSRIF